MPWAKLGSLALRYWYVGAILGLALWGWHLTARIDTVKAERDALQAWQENVRDVTSKAAHIQRDGKPALLRLDAVPVQIANLGASFDVALSVIERKNAETIRRGNLLAGAREQDRLNREDAARRFATQSASIERLRAMAGARDDGTCPADPALLRELEGL